MILPRAEILNMAADLYRCSGPHAKTEKFEVETKFRPPVDLKDTLGKLGAKLVQETTFKDAYFDSPKHELTLSGCWLRKRNQRWELKIQKLKRRDEWIESNSEFDNEREIAAELLKRLPGYCSSTDRELTGSLVNVENILKRTQCTEIASFTTCRSVYQMQNGGMVDLDEASFGYQVGEVEVIVSDDKDISLAKETVQKTLELLGVQGRVGVPGKVEVYLKQHCRPLYDQLAENGIF